jgi:hypothetical protein
VTVDVPVDAGLPPTDLAGIVAHQCSVLCSVCHDQLDGGDCASNCAQLLYSIQGEVDTVCVGSVSSTHIGCSAPGAFRQIGTCHRLVQD